MPVRSLAIARQRNVTPHAANLLYTVPAGHTLLVSDIRLANPTTQSVDVMVGVRSGSVTWPIVRRPMPAVSDHAVSEARVTLEPGDELVWVPNPITGASNDVSIYVSGALLEGTAE